MLAPHLVARVRAERQARRFRAGDASPWVRTTLRKAVQERVNEIVGAAPARPRRERRPQRGRARPRRRDRRGAGLRREPLAARARTSTASTWTSSRRPAAPAASSSRCSTPRCSRRARCSPPSSCPTCRPTSAPSTRRTSTAPTPGPSPPRRPWPARSTCRPSACCARTASTASAPSCGASGSRPSRGRASTTASRSSWAGPRGRCGTSPASTPASRARRSPRRRRGARGLLPADVLGGLPSRRQTAVPRDRQTSPHSVPAASYLTLQAMVEVERPGDELAWRAFGSGRKIAWKTGTSYGFRDAWAVGVTPRHAVGVWVGNADGEGRPGLTGHSAAAPILFDLFDALPGGGWFAPPARGPRGRGRLRPQRHARRAPLRDASGRARAAGRARLAGRARSAGSSTPTRAPAWQVHGDCEPVAAIRSTAWFVLPPAMETHYRRFHADYRPPPPYRPDCRAAAGRRGQRLALLRLPARGRRRLRPGGDGRRGRPRRLRGGAPRPRGARLLAPRRRVPGRDARHPPDGARPAPGAARAGPGGRAGRDRPPPLHRARDEAGAVLLRFQAGL